MSPRVSIAAIIGLRRHTQADMIESAVICWEASWTSRRVWASQIFHSKCCGAHIIYCEELGLVMVCLVDTWVCGITCSYRLATRSIISIRFYDRDGRGRWKDGWKKGSKQSTCCDVFLSSRLVHGQEAVVLQREKPWLWEDLDHCRQHSMIWVFQKLHDMEIQNGIKMAASWERISIMGGAVHPSASGLASSCRHSSSQTCKKTDIEKQTSSII